MMTMVIRSFELLSLALIMMAMIAVIVTPSTRVVHAFPFATTAKLACQHTHRAIMPLYTAQAENDNASIARTTASTAIMMTTTADAHINQGTKNEDDYMTIVEEELQAQGLLEEWEKCIQILTVATGSESPTDIPELLASVWKWKTWATTTSKFARKYIKPVAPNASDLQQAVDWIQKHGPLATKMTKDPIVFMRELTHSLSPTILAFWLSNPEENYAKAKAAAPQTIQEENDFDALVLEYPEILATYYNCATNENGCASECGHCWVTLQTKLGEKNLQ